MSKETSTSFEAEPISGINPAVPGIQSAQFHNILVQELALFLKNKATDLLAEWQSNKSEIRSFLIEGEYPNSSLQNLWQNLNDFEVYLKENLIPLFEHLEKLKSHDRRSSSFLKNQVLAALEEWPNWLFVRQAHFLSSLQSLDKTPLNQLIQPFFQSQLEFGDLFESVLPKLLKGLTGLTLEQDTAHLAEP